MHLEQKAFPLRLPVSLRAKAAEVAKTDGISLNSFITIAVAEKIAQMGHQAPIDHSSNGHDKRRVL